MKSFSVPNHPQNCSLDNARIEKRRSGVKEISYPVEAVSKCFPLTAGFKIKEGDPAMAGLTTPLKKSGTGIHTLSISRIKI